MSEPTEDRQSSGTALDVQRLDAGYFEHMESLREQVAVGRHLVSRQTARWALVSMAAITVLLFILFPFTMFYQFSFVVMLVYLLAFVAFGWMFYDRIVAPNEGTETWRD